MFPLIDRLRRPETRARLRAERDRYQRELTTERLTAAELRTELAREREQHTAAARIASRDRVLPQPVQALIDWYLREPLTAVLALPSRDSIRTALDSWRPHAAGLCEKCHQRPPWTPEQAGQWPGGHFCEPCIADCHVEVAGHMCIIDRWRPVTAA